MKPGQVIGMLCNVCKQIIKINDKNHICSFDNHLKYLILAQRTPISTNIFRSFNDDILNNTHETESLEEVVEVCLETQSKEPEHDDDDDSEMLSTLISSIRQRRPLWDYRVPLSARFEPIKKLLWSEVYAELKGEYSIDILKNKWRYLREKYNRENKKPKSGSGSEKRKSWVHMQSLQFLDDVSTKNKKTSSNFSLTFEIPDSEVTPCKRKRDESSFQEGTVNEIQASRKIPPQPYEQPQEADNEDTSFAKYIINIMKHIPKKQKIVLQSEIISNLVQYIDD
ncbi:unnamed protein product [Macrosiphum euphorbiae]|uniref:MADF domain-containing protein n=1 Tax=Macrosiphum euphorbiae TaxID=13131 RepID=A0AAV0XDG8_9HEMI|nr:unnamed protein product [Macrosiphum euphorbiae]